MTGVQTCALPILIAPDFYNGPMAADWVGTSYGCGQDKLSRGRIGDALLTAFDTRVRIAFSRANRRRRIAKGDLAFPVLLHPRCLYFDEFVPDCDAIYPACPEEVIEFLLLQPGFSGQKVFFRKGGTFGLAVFKS